MPRTRGIGYGRAPKKSTKKGISAHGERQAQRQVLDRKGIGAKRTAAKAGVDSRAAKSKTQSAVDWRRMFGGDNQADPTVRPVASTDARPRTVFNAADAGYTAPVAPVEPAKKSFINRWTGQSGASSPAGIYDKVDIPAAELQRERFVAPQPTANVSGGIDRMAGAESLGGGIKRHAGAVLNESIVAPARKLLWGKDVESTAGFAPDPGFVPPQGGGQTGLTSQAGGMTDLGIEGGGAPAVATERSVSDAINNYMARINGLSPDEVKQLLMQEFGPDARRFFGIVDQMLEGTGIAPSGFGGGASQPAPVSGFGQQ